MRVRLQPGIIAAVLIVVVLSVPLSLIGPVQAQGGLTDEELALLDRVAAVHQNFEALTSYVEEIEGTQNRELTVVLRTGEQPSSTTTTWERRSQVTKTAGDKSIASHLFATIQNQGQGPDGQPASQIYSIDADVRRVDGKLYISAQYDTPRIDPGWPELPAGWIQVNDPAEWQVFEELNLRDFFDESSPYDNLNQVKAVAPEVTSEPGTLEDGTPVDTITVTFDADAIQTLFSGGPNNDPFMAALLANLSDETYSRLTVVVDADDLPRQMLVEQALVAVGMDAALLRQRQLPRGATFDFKQEISRDTTYSQFNASFDPIIAPENTVH